MRSAHNSGSFASVICYRVASTELDHRDFVFSRCTFMRRRKTKRIKCKIQFTHRVGLRRGGSIASGVSFVEPCSLFHEKSRAKIELPSVIMPEEGLFQ